MSRTRRKCVTYKTLCSKVKIALTNIDLGPLHGIPYGLKDIIAVPEYKTTWGSRTFENQILDVEASVYKRFVSSQLCTLCVSHVINSNYVSLCVCRPPSD